MRHVIFHTVTNLINLTNTYSLVFGLSRATRFTDFGFICSTYSSMFTIVKPDFTRKGSSRKVSAASVSLNKSRSSFRVIIFLIKFACVEKVHIISKKACPR